MTKRTIYVVDDEEPIRNALRMMLSVQGYTVTPFATGQSFLTVINSLVPGCVLLDVRMPDRDGLDVQRRLAGQRSDLPVVMMTGHGDLGVAAAALQNGAVAFVEKPFAKATLRRAIDAAFLRLEDPGRYKELVDQTRQAVEALDDEDRALLAKLAGGRSAEAIAGELQVPKASIEVRRARLFAALGIDSASEAIAMAFASGLVVTAPLRDITY